VFAVEQVDERLEQRLDVLAAVVAELDEEMEQPQHLNAPTTTRAHTNTAGMDDRGRAGCGSWGGARAPFPPASGSGDQGEL